MATKLEIINSALVCLAQPPIRSLEDNNPILGSAIDIYDRLVVDGIARHPWTWSFKWVEATLSTETPDLPEFSKAYHMPADCIQLYRNYPLSNYTISGELIYANASPPWKLQYQYLPSAASFSPLFATYLSYAIASDFAPLLTENYDLGQYWGKKADQALITAMNRDATSMPNPAIRSNELWLTRFVAGGTNVGSDV